MQEDSLLAEALLTNENVATIEEQHAGETQLGKSREGPKAQVFKAANVDINVDNNVLSIEDKVQLSQEQSNDKEEAQEGEPHMHKGKSLNSNLLSPLINRIAKKKKKQQTNLKHINICLKTLQKKSSFQS